LDAICCLFLTLSLSPQLEEALLLSSALIDPSDEEALDKLEAEVEQVRKDGGLNEKEEEEADSNEAGKPDASS
jgi:hypothetical protein